MKAQTFSAEKRNLLDALLKDEDGVETATTGIPLRNLQIDGMDAFPLSFSQLRLWFLDQLEPGSAFYNFPLAVPFNVAVNTAILERSINEIVKRHEALRTVFGSVGGEPVQIVLPELALPLAVFDLRSLDKEAQDAEMTRLAAEWAQRPFDLARGPLLRTALLRRGPDDNVFLLVMHHIISDGWSLGVFWRELIALYNAFYVNRPSPLPELAIQYADFSVWQRERLRGERLEELVSYWKKQLAGMPVLQLPTDRPRPPVLSYRGAFQELVLPRALTDALRTLSQREGTTLFMTLFAAFTVLLQRYTGQSDIVVGSYVASRDRAELENLIGFFINSLVLRADLAGDPTFRTLLGRVREMALDAYAHQELPFEKLVEELQPERDLSRNPLFQVSFQLFSAQAERGAAAGPDGTPTIDLNRGMAIFDIAVNIWDGPDGLSGHLEYSTDLFDPATMARLTGHFRNLLKSAVTSPDAKLSELDMLSESEKRQLLVEWNDTSAEIPEAGVHALFEQQVARNSDAVALVAEGASITYGELNRRANRLAHRLRLMEVGPGSVVGICFERGGDMVAAILAVLKAGGAYLPLDPSYPSERLAFMLQDSGAKIVISEERAFGRLPPHDAEILRMDDDAVFAGQSEANPPASAGPDDLCYVIYTSGSTGKPKGVMGPHRGTVNRLQWMWSAYPFEAGETVCQKTALSFVDSIWELFGGLLQGVKTLVLPDETVRDPRKLVDALARAKVSRIVLVPSLLRAMLTSGIDLAAELPHLKFWTLSGEALSYDLFTDFRQDVPHARILNLYGSSEVAADVLCCDLGTTEPVAKSVPIGRPIANTEAYVLDRDQNLVPIGVPGELYVGGHGLARAYHNRPELTAESFIASPFDGAKSARLYRTRDQVRYRADGQIEYLGRLDHQVKLRGYRVELGEIETALAEHRLVREAAASVVQVGGEENRLIAYVVPADGDGANVADDPGAELASRWQTVWNETYVGTEAGSGSFNTIGWNSSYSGEAISEPEMREWVEQTVDRVLSFAPKRVLEIGCGTGLVLLRVADRCVDYVATDFSRIALDQVRREIEKAPEKYRCVSLLEREATDFDGLEGPFDLIILNSVIQYFPGAPYLAEVLKGALGLLAPSGSVFIGDVRSLSLLRGFHTAVELHHAPDDLSADVLSARIHRQVVQEKELAVDPAVFHAFGPDVAQVTVDLKRGTLVNEMMQFRYDVTLRREAAPLASSPDSWMDWRADEMTLERLRDLLSAERPAVLGVTGVPNGRLGKPMKALELLATASLAAAGELRRAVERAEHDGIDPEAVWALGGEFDYDVAVGWLGLGGDGCYDIVFRRREPSSPHRGFGFPSAGMAHGAAGEQHVTNPAAGVRMQILIADLRAHLQKRLPHYMVPASIVVLENLPQTPNGKVDRRALPAPNAVRDRFVNTYVAPRNRTERQLAAIWSDVLNVERIGVRDNFFELGGHSLLATQLVSRIRIEFNSEMPVRAIFEMPTIAALAMKLDRRPGGAQRPAESGIGRISPAGALRASANKRNGRSGRAS
ncbi:MAG: amino acid adenylation domain-containing protein [Rhizomicrobium sp.]